MSDNWNPIAEGLTITTTMTIHGPNSPYVAVIGPDYMAIRIGEAPPSPEHELLYWDEAEWEHEPDLLGTILQMQRLAVTNPDEFKREHL